MIIPEKVLAIIPARAGSKGVQGKNYKIVGGKPLIYYSLEAALKSNYIDTVVVSSNDPQVQRVCTDFMHANKNMSKKLEWHDRSEKLASDQASSDDVVLDIVQKDKYSSYDIIVLLQPTSPIRHVGLIDNCIKEMRFGFDSCFTVQKITPFMYTKNKNKVFSFIDMSKDSGEITRYNRPMRQDISEYDYYYHDCGNVYCFYKNTIESFRRRIGDNPTAVEVSEMESLQIDSVSDLGIAESIADKYKGLLLE